MVFDGSYFTYGDFDSEDYNLIFAHAGTSVYESLHGEVGIGTVFHKRGLKNYYTGDDYSSSPIRFNIDIVTEDGTAINSSDVRAIENALFGNKRYRKLYVNRLCDPESYASSIVNGYEKRLYFNCKIMNPEKIENASGICGFSVTVECDSGFMWQDPVKATIHSGITNILCDTDFDSYIYPKVTIRVRNGGSVDNITLCNLSDSSTRLTSFTNLDGINSIELYMNGEINMVKPIDYYNFMVDRNFLRLKPGINSISVSDGVDVDIEWSNRRFIV